MFQGQIEKLPLKSRGNWAIFQLLPYFLPNKNYIFETFKKRAIISQSLAILA